MALTEVFSAIYERMGGYNMEKLSRLNQKSFGQAKLKVMYTSGWKEMDLEIERFLDKD